jgi:hypothetical protein
MANMSYCRFENTVIDMKDCLNDLAEAVESGLSMKQFLERLSSDYERRAVEQMLTVLNDMTEVMEQLVENSDLSEEELENLDNDD